MAKYQWKSRYQKDGLRINKIILFRTGGERLEEVAVLRGLEASTRPHDVVKGVFQVDSNITAWSPSENFMIGMTLEYRRSGRKMFHTHHHVKITEFNNNSYSFIGKKGFTKYG